MQFYYSPHSDVILSALSIAMLLAGVICLAISREKTLTRAMPSFRYVGISLLILAIREWMGIIGISNRDFHSFYAFAAIMQTLAAVPLLLAARREAPSFSNRLKVIHLTFALTVAFLLGVLVEPFFDYQRYIHSGAELVSTGLFFFVKAYFAIAAFLLYYCVTRSENPPSRGFRRAFGLLALYALIVFFCRPSGLPAHIEPPDFIAQYIMPTLYGVRIIVAFYLAVMVWNLYARSLGVTGRIRWWPLAAILFMTGVGFLFVSVSCANYEKAVRHNLAAAAGNAAAVIPPDALRAAAAAPGSETNPAVIGRVFDTVRQLGFIIGNSRIDIHIDALAFDPATAGVAALIDFASHPTGGQWAAGDRPLRSLWENVRSRKIVIEKIGSRDFAPILAMAIVPGSDSQPAGAAVLSLSAADLALDLFIFKRLVVLFLPGAVFLILMLLSGHQRAWLAAHSSSRLEALKSGALGNDLTGVVITRQRTIIHANPRSCAIAGVEARALIGKDIRTAFDLPNADLRSLGERVVRELRNKGSSQYETAIRNQAGDVIHLLVYVRKLNDDPHDDHYIWETVDITRQKEMENEIRDSRDYLQSIIDMLPEAVFVKDSQSRYQLVNRSFAKIYGLCPAVSVIGKTMADIRPHEAELSRTNDEIARDMNGGTLVYERCIEVEGEQRFIEISKTCRRLSDAPGDYIVLGTIHDFTDRQKSEDALSAERHFLMQLINTLPVTVCFLDRDRKIRLCDNDFAREAGVDDPEELHGRPYDDVMPFGQGTGGDQAQLDQGGGISDEEFEVAKDGRTRNFILRRCVMQSADGEVLGLVKAFWDTTALVAANRAAKKADRAKAAFLANMSHELRTPMNGIVGMADLIVQNAELGVIPRLYAETIIKSAKTLQMVMDEVMDVATMDDDAKRLALTKAAFPLLPLAEEAVDIVSCLAEAWGVELALYYDYELEGLYHGDARRLRQIIVQILTHCSHLTGNQRLGLSIARGEARNSIRIETFFSPRAGLTPEKLEEMFKNTAARQDLGATAVSINTGMFNDRIGLPLVWRLIQAMDGTMAASGDKRGLVCTVDIPLGAARNNLGPVRPPNLRTLRLLAVTAQPERAGGYLDGLAYAGVDVVSAGDGEDVQQTLEAACRNAQPFHFLLVDSRMLPEKKLGTFLADIAAQPELAQLQILLVVATRNLQRLDSAVGTAARLVLPPLTPLALWSKISGLAAGILPDEDEDDGDKAAEARRNSTRITRGVRFPIDVLLVEDNAVNQMVEIGLLKRLGCRPVLALNGEEAVKRITRGEEYSIILMDCMMPVMDGYEATGRIRIHERSVAGAKRNTIVALTANTVAGDKEKCLASGMDDYMTKPVTLRMIRDILLKYCSAHAIVVDEAEGPEN